MIKAKGERSLQILHTAYILEWLWMIGRKDENMSVDY